jgi:hypothetical protein
MTHDGTSPPRPVLPFIVFIMGSEATAQLHSSHSAATLLCAAACFHDNPNFLDVSSTVLAHCAPFCAAIDWLVIFSMQARTAMSIFKRTQLEPCRVYVSRRTAEGKPCEVLLRYSTAENASSFMRDMGLLSRIVPLLQHSNVKLLTRAVGVTHPHHRLALYHL